MKLFCIALLVVLPGCLSAPALHELANDPATVTLRVKTLYGDLDFSRSWPSNAVWVPTVQTNR